MAYESLLLCQKCHSNLVIPKRIIVKKLTSSCQKAFVKVANSSIFSYLMASHYNQMKVRGIPQGLPAYYIPMGPMPTSIPPAQFPQELRGLPGVPLTPPVASSPSSQPPPTSPMSQVPISSFPLKTCTNCNATLAPNAVFCKKCGLPVDIITDTAPRCPFCGATLSYKARICPKCSSEVRCQKCDALLSSNARFCVKCGEPLKGKVEEIEAPVLICHFCSASLELSDTICPECGKPTKCPTCSNHLKSGVRFCNKCGTDVSEITLTGPEAGEAEEIDEEEEVKGAMETVTCSDCGATMSKLYVFCTQCGTKLEK